ncbi:hypothetical protein CCM_04851 [Cordyceps militaris CM01]|uniref:Uncharacterized protein n=1 Tax=Cordyceps militaris (strain CM01) TaxID=983644 RepID=G3JEY4_CORMM|nr:uncharacterized protein CCM_04851 [Cordyceps militaris CM01]EGX93477.1 hypothetical protein CCM_04851 [Cordyceps militaris CM01]
MRSAKPKRRSRERWEIEHHSLWEGGTLTAAPCTHGAAGASNNTSASSAKYYAKGGGRGRLESSTVEEEDKSSGRSARISSRKNTEDRALAQKAVVAINGRRKGTNPPVCPRYRSVLKIGMEIYPVIDRGLVSKVAVIGAVKATYRTCARKMELGRCPSRVEHDSDDNLGGACPILRAECQTERRILRPQNVAVMALSRLANSSNYCPAEIHSYSHTRSVKVSFARATAPVLASTKQNRRDHQPNLASLRTGSGLNIPNQGPFVGTKSRGKKKKKEATGE